MGQRVRALREQAEMTLAALSKATGVTVSAIHRLEDGKDVRLSTYFPVIRYFGSRDPQAWILAERIVSLPEAQRVRLARAGGLGGRNDG